MTASRILLLIIGVLILIGWNVAVWPYVVNSYAQLLVSILQPLVSDETQLQVTTHEVIVYDHKGTPIVQKSLDSMNEFGLLLALFLAVPLMPFSQRMQRLLLALGIQIALHIVELSLLIWIAYEFYFGINKQSFAYWLLNLLMAGNLIFPILLWALLSWRFWLPKLAPQPHQKPKEARP
ncbi:MAG: hypothetical protein NZ930_01175 [Candidatus Bipolaricaulota bacterium]|nr:hypothetical protein [Candidatus Bipolaricaulota bacterium]MDW8031314.1 hypothetical protein [Candidatus Bipolaricaulota bacterium]